MRHSSAFTLIELLVVIAILAVLAVVVVLTLNPAGLLQEARDANRISDMATLNSALGLSLADNASESLGSANTVYVSVPDPTATSSAGDQCQGLGLLTLPSGFSYHCAASSTSRKTDATGWIPVNLSANTFGSSMVQLPQDPINTTSSRLYYTYETDGAGRYEATTPFESAKYKLGGTSDQITGDGGTLASVYEKGSKLGLEPLDYGDSSLVGLWTFDEGTGTTAYDWSGKNATGSWNGTPTGTVGFYSPGRIGSWAGAFDGNTNLVNTNYKPNTISAFSISAWFNVNAFKSGGNNEETIFGSEDSVGNGVTLGFNRSGGNVLTLYAPKPDLTITVPATFSLNTWYHVVVVFDGANNGAVYVNGVVGASGVRTQSTVNAALLIGARNTSYFRSFNGFIDDIRVYNRALSAAEVAALYNGGK